MDGWAHSNTISVKSEIRKTRCWLAKIVELSLQYWNVMDMKWKPKRSVGEYVPGMCVGMDSTFIMLQTRCDIPYKITWFFSGWSEQHSSTFQYIIRIMHTVCALSRTVVVWQLILFVSFMVTVVKYSVYIQCFLWRHSSYVVVQKLQVVVIQAPKSQGPLNLNAITITIDDRCQASSGTLWSYLSQCELASPKLYMLMQSQIIYDIDVYIFYVECMWVRMCNVCEVLHELLPKRITCQSPI